MALEIIADVIKKFRVTKGLIAVRSTFKVRAVRWDGGWELHIEDEGVTQVRTLDRGEAQVRDYLATLHETPADHVTVEIVPDLGGLESEVLRVRNEVRDAAAAQMRAGEHSRKLAKELRGRGLSVADTATVLGVSKGRVSQLVN